MEITLDPRAIRTRKLLIDSFNQILQTKDFDHVSIKEITELATVNRATFYAHFVDKFELLSIVLNENIIGTLNKHFTNQDPLDKQGVEKLFIGIEKLHNNMHAGCRKGYNTFTRTIEDKTKAHLVDIVIQTMATPDRKKAVMFSWALYGCYNTWLDESTLPAEQYAMEIAPALLRLLSEV